ncbi:MAG: hypothetical protein ACLFQB_08840 [Chitinispirillaceae bacterium]
MMTYPLRHYLLESYESRRTNSLPRRITRDIPIQIDDQDDNDSLTEFCNLFCTVKSNKQFSLELVGKVPITRPMAELAEIYNGYADFNHGRLVFNLNINQINVLIDLANKIKDTALMGPMINNPKWYRISARTISSLHRFVRMIQEYTGN